MSSASQRDVEAHGLDLVRRDFAEVRGKLVTARAARVYRDNDSDDLSFNEPYPVFRVGAIGAEVDRRCGDGEGEWWDPVYCATPQHPGDPRLAGCRSFYLFGVSRRVSNPDDTEPGDIVSVIE